MWWSVLILWRPFTNLSMWEKHWNVERISLIFISISKVIVCTVLIEAECKVGNIWETLMKKG